MNIRTHKRSLSVDIARGELVEAELDRLIAARSRKRDPEEEHDRRAALLESRGEGTR
jgi:hypothetical protein